MLFKVEEAKNIDLDSKRERGSEMKHKRRMRTMSDHI